MTTRQQTAVALGPLLLALLTTLAIGQGHSSSPEILSEVKAIVTDATGALIPHSEVTFKGESATIVSYTSMDGSVTVKLRTGRYAVTFARTGFVTAKLVDLQISAPTPSTFRVVLQVDSTPTDGGELMGVPTTTSELPTVVIPTSVHRVQESTQKSDCATNHFVMHKTPCLCGEVTITSGDIALDPTAFGLDDTLDIELRDKAGKPIESKRISYRKERNFCFSGKPRGRYTLAFVLYEAGKPQPAAVFPTKYTAKGSEACNVIYLVPPVCPK